METLTNAILNGSFWKGERVLLTGHTGFKGTWLLQWLIELGADVARLSFSGYTKTLLGISTTPLLIEIDVDISNSDWQKRISDYAPEIVFHLAAQSLVFTGLKDPKMTFETNVVDSMHVLELLKRVPSIRAMTVITTDKVYRIEKDNRPRIETDPLGSNDPYSASKGAVELMVNCWPINSNQSIATTRSDNVIGGEDDASKRLIPYLVRAWKEGHALSLRSPSGIRLWLLVLEPLRGYLLLAEKCYSSPGARFIFNFAPDILDQVRVDAIAKRVVEILPQREGFTINTLLDAEFPETPELLLNASKAYAELDWKPIWLWTTAADKALNWYQQFHQGVNSDLLFKQDIYSCTEELGN